MAASTPESRRPTTTASDDERSIPPSEGGSADHDAGSGVAGYDNDNSLEQAFEHPNNNLFAVVEDLYHDVVVKGKRIKAVWRDGDDYNVVINDRTMYDHVSGESYNAWTFLTKIVGLSPAEAAKYLKARANLSNNHPQTRRARRQIEQADDEETQRQKFLAKKLVDAFEKQRTSPTTGHSGYFERKGITALFETHEVADVTFKGERLPGMIYSSDKRGPFVQLAYANLEGEVTGCQRIYDDKVLPGERDKDFIGPTKGSFILLQPKGVPLPRDNKALTQLLAAGHEADTCEGVATGASAALVSPKNFVLCALSKENLEPVLEALQECLPDMPVTLISDNDAKPFTKDGKPKENGGQKKAHTLALRFKHKVAVTRIAGKERENVDLNDVLVECGPEAVRQQLADARHADPHYAVPNDGGAAFLRNYELAKDYDCTVTVSRGRYLDPLELLRGITALCGAMGTGKTEAVEKLVKGRLDLTVLALSHLQGLTGSLANRLGLTDYRTIKQGRERKFRRAAYCINSLWRLIDSQVGLIQTFDMVFLDEIEQLLRRLTSRKNFRRKRQCLDALEHIVKSARYVVVADAHVGRTTMRWLKRLRPQDRPHMVLGSYTPGTGRTVYKHERRGDVRVAAREALLAGEHVYYATNGLERAHEVNGWFNELKVQMPELRTLLVCSDTAGEEPVKAFFRDPSAESRKYDLIVASPSVSTGVSIKAGHFGVACGEFGTRVGTPNDALQALSRVRECPTLHVYVETRRANLKTDPADIRAGFWTKPGDDVEMSAGCDFETNRLLIQANYAALYEDVKSAEATAINAYTDTFWELVSEDGYTVESGRSAPTARTIEKQATESAKALRKVNLLKAPDLNESEARELSEARRRGDATRDDVAALERHNLVKFYRLEDPAGELPDLIDADRRGELRREIERFELTVSDDAAATAKVHEQEKMDKLPPDFERYDHQHHAYSTTLRAAGLDLTTLTTSGRRYTAEELLETWVKPLAAMWHVYERTVPAWPELKYAQQQPIKALGGVLKGAFGLKHHRAGKSEGGAYTLRDEPLEARRAWIAKREQIISFINNHNGTSVPAAPVPAPSVPSAPLDDAGEPSAPQTAADERRTTPRKPFGYEALRFYVLKSEPGPKRDLLLESFGYADDGDEQATEALTGYLQKPEVQEMIGAAA